MLSNKQWQWCADNHKKVRTFCILGVVVGVWLYIGLIIKTGLDKGKAPIPFTPRSNFSSMFKCEKKMEVTHMGPFGGNIPSKSGYYKDARGWMLERHETFMYDSELLINSPECVGAMMADSSNSPNPFVIILYDTKNNRPLYRIARIDNALKR